MSLRAQARKVRYIVLGLSFFAAKLVYATELTPALELAYRIELELLSDPLTFPYTWHIQVTNQGVEIAGIVPGDDVRERALHLANRVTNVPVQDRILVQTMPRPAKLPPRSPRELGEAVRQRLEQARLGGADRALEINIYPDTTGIVTLRGWVPSPWDKLLASRCLRDLEQCLAVRNLLEARSSSNQIVERLDSNPKWASEQNWQPDPFVWRPPPSQPEERSNTSAVRAVSHSQRLWAPPLYPSLRHMVNLGSNQQTTVNGSANQTTTSYTNQLIPQAMQARSIARPSDGTIAGSYSRMPIPVSANPSNQILASDSLVSMGPEMHTSTDPFASSLTIRTTPVLTATYSGPATITHRSRQDYKPTPKTISHHAAPNIRSGISIAGDHGLPGQTASAPSTRAYPAMRSLPSVPAAPSPKQTGSQTFAPSNAHLATRPTSLGVTAAITNVQTLRTRIMSALAPNVQDVQVLDMSGSTLHLKIRVPSVEAIDRIAPSLFQLPDLEGYEIQVQFEVTAPLSRQ